MLSSGVPEGYTVLRASELRRCDVLKGHVRHALLTLRRAVAPAGFLAALGRAERQRVRWSAGSAHAACVAARATVLTRSRRNRPRAGLVRRKDALSGRQDAVRVVGVLRQLEDCPQGMEVVMPVARRHGYGINGIALSMAQSEWDRRPFAPRDKSAKSLNPSNREGPGASCSSQGED